MRTSIFAIDAAHKISAVRRIESLNLGVNYLKKTPENWVLPSIPKELIPRSARATFNNLDRFIGVNPVNFSFIEIPKQLKLKTISNILTGMSTYNK